MVQNGLTPENIYEKAATMAFPDSVVSYFKGMMGQPMGGFPERLQKLVLKGEEPITCRPGELLAPLDFDAISEKLSTKYRIEPTMKDILSYALYPEVFEGYLKFRAQYGDLGRIGSDVFFHGLSEGETIEAEVAEGKALMIKLLTIGKPDQEGNRTLVFEVNRNRREIKIKDKNSTMRDSKNGEFTAVEMADPDNINEIGSPIPGTVISVLVKEGEQVAENQAIVVVEAMKMETRITSPKAGTIASVNVSVGQQVKSGELLIVIK
jgi:pyruvate carboxylase